MLRVLFLVLALGLATAAATHAEPGGPMGRGCGANC
jgi:hypothetical protein